MATVIALNRETRCETIADCTGEKEEPPPTIHEVAEAGAPVMKRVSGLKSVNGPVMYISHRGPQRTGGSELTRTVKQSASSRVRAHVLALRIRGALGSAMQAHLGNFGVMFAMGSTK